MLRTLSYTPLIRGLLSATPLAVTSTTQRFVSQQYIYHRIDWKEPKKLDEVLYPPNRRRLHPVMKVPNQNISQKPLMYPKRMIDRRGPEPVHNKLIHGQFGLQAIDGGELNFRHFEMLRLNVNRQIDERQMFAVWRVDSPWKPKTKRSIGRTLGGGRPDISFYVTPVKPDRIIFEVGGVLSWREAYKIITSVALKTPFPSRFIAQEMLEEEEKIEAMIKEENVNPFTFEKALEENMAGSRDFMSPWHVHWGGKYR